MTLCSLAKATIFLKNSRFDHGRGRIVRKIDDQNLRPWKRLPIDPLKIIEKIAVLPQLDASDFSACDDETVHVNGIGRRWRQHDIAGADHRQGQMRQPFFGADRDDGFGLRIEVDIVVPLVPSGDRMAQLGNASRGRIAVIFALASRFDHLLDDVAGRRLIWISHSKVDDVLALLPGFQLKALDLGKDVGREPLEPIKIRRPVPWRPAVGTLHSREEERPPSQCDEGLF